MPPKVTRFALILFLAAAALKLDYVSSFSSSLWHLRPAVTPGASNANGNACRQQVLYMSISAIDTPAAIGAPSGAIPLALKKPSKTLTVCLEYRRRNEEDFDAPEPTELDLSALSMQLRKIKASAIFTSDVQALAAFAKEQESARGDFPGPCPVVYNGNTDNIAAAREAGASAIVLGLESQNISAETITGTDIIWKVSSPQDVETVLTIQESADSFLVAGDDVEATIAALPGTNSCAIGIVDAMQDEDAEIVKGRSLKAAGCVSVYICGAVAGDEEDLDYASFAVAGLTSKASSEFNFSGLTGSANGHFGGVASSRGKNQWKRNLSTKMIATGTPLEEIETEEQTTDATKTDDNVEARNDLDSDADPIVSSEDTTTTTIGSGEKAKAFEVGDEIEATNLKAEEALYEHEENIDEPELVSKLSDAAKYFLASSGLRKNIPREEARLASLSVKDREDAARKTLDPRMERLGIAPTEKDEEV